MPEDHLSPTGYIIPVQAARNEGLSVNDILGYAVASRQHGYSEGGRASLQIAVSEGHGPLDPEEFLPFYDAIVCALAEKGIDVKGSAAFSGRGLMLKENDQVTEKPYYNEWKGGDGRFLAVGNEFNDIELKDPAFWRQGEQWIGVDVAEFFIADTDETRNLTDEEFAEMIRQAYYEAVKGVDNTLIPKLDYRGNGNEANVDTLPRLENECKPVALTS